MPDYYEGWLVNSAGDMSLGGQRGENRWFYCRPCKNRLIKFCSHSLDCQGKGRPDGSGTSSATEYSGVDYVDDYVGNFVDVVLILGPTYLLPLKLYVSIRTAHVDDGYEVILDKLYELMCTYLTLETYDDQEAFMGLYVTSNEP